MDKKQTLLNLLKQRKNEIEQQKVSSKLEELLSTLDNENVSLKGEKGEKGDKGDKGEKGEKGDKGIIGADGKDGRDGIDGLDGKDGTNGIDGTAGKDGRDGSPDTSFDIRNKLELLNGDERLDLRAVKGVEALRNGILEVMNQGLMSMDKNKVLGIKQDGQQIGFANEINFIGATVKPNTNQGVDVTITGGGSAVWGSITGTLSDQTDLQTALDALVPYTGGTSNLDLINQDISASTFSSASDTSTPFTIKMLDSSESILVSDITSGFDSNLYFNGITANRSFSFPDQSGTLALTSDIPSLSGYIKGSGTTNEISYFTASDTIASLTTATYPSLTELSYVKGVTSAIQTQLDAKGSGSVTSVATDSTLTGGTITTTGTLGINLSNANSWTAAQTGLFTGLGTSTVDAFILSNTTAAALGAQQISPSLHFQGQGWATGSSTSQSVDYRINLLPAQATNAAGTLQFQSSLNGGAWNNEMTLTTGGTMTVQGAIIGGASGSNAVSFGSVGTSNFASYSSNIGAGSTDTKYIFGGASTVMFRNVLGGSISSVTLGASNSYANTIIAASPITTPATGTNAMLANLVVRPLGTVTPGGASITNTASLYIDGASSAGTNNYALMVNSGNTFLGGLITTYNGAATAGNGVISVQGAGRATAQTAANSSIATYTVGASDASFMVSANVNVTASTTHTIAVQVDYTDEGNVSRTVTLSFSQLAGTIINSITNVTGTGPYEGIPIHIRAKASTAITVKTTGTFTSVTYNVEGIISKLQ